MRYMLISLLAIAILVVSTHAQPPDPKKDAIKKDTQKPVAPMTDTDPPRLDTASSAFLIVCDAQPSKVLVLDSNGKWIPTVKSVEIKFELGGTGTITCVLYEGSIRPTKPQVKSWTLSQVKTITSSDFQQLVDGLQTDPDAIKSMLKKE